MASFSQVEGDLKSLIGTTTIEKIVAAILSIDKLSIKNQQLLKRQDSPYEDMEEVQSILEDTRNMFVAFTYQRFLKLRVLLKHLENSDGNFHAARAGVLNVRRRSNGELYLWDGLRRAVLGGLKGIWKIPTLVIPHDFSMPLSEQEKEEAADFSSFNGKGMESMRQEEIWKADCVAQEKAALKLKDIFIDCGIDVLNVVGNNGWGLSGFQVFRQCALGIGSINIDREYLRRACSLISSSFNGTRTFAGYAVCGIAYYLQLVDELVDECADGETTLNCELVDDLDISDDTILEHLKTFFKREDIVQGNLINPNQSNRQVESVSYNLFNKVIRNHFKGERITKLVDIHTLLIDKLGLDKHNFLVEID